MRRTTKKRIEARKEKPLSPTRAIDALIGDEEQAGRERKLINFHQSFEQRPERFIYQDSRDQTIILHKTLHTAPQLSPRIF